MKNKKHQLKPALILCFVVFAVIMIMYIISGNVNKNVVENMKGQVIYKQGENLCMYDFDERKESTLVEDTDFEKALFYGEDFYLYLSNGNLYIYGEDSKAFTDSGKVIDFDCSNYNEDIVYIIEDNDKYVIYRYDAKEDETESVYESDKEIYSVAFSDEHDNIFYTENNKDETILYCIDEKDKTKEWIRAKDIVLDNVEIREKMVFLTQLQDGTTDSIIRYVKGASKATELDFNSKEYNCTNLVPVYDEQYLVTSDKSGAYRIYVCNGSNMVEVTGAGTDKEIVLMDYMNSEE